MIRYIFLIFFISMAVSINVFATSPAIGSLDYILQAPPTSEDTLSLYQYLNVLYNRWNTLQVTTQEPNGNLSANYGNIVVYQNGTTYSLAVETTAPSGTTWKGIALGAV